MANEQNLIPFTERTKKERQELGRKGGKASGEARRRRANFKKTLNILLTSEFKDENADILEAMGLECTAESAMNVIMIRKALAGDIRAYEAVARYSGQETEKEARTNKHIAQADEYRARIEKLKAEVEQIKNTGGMTAEDKIEALFNKINEGLDDE